MRKFTFNRKTAYFTEEEYQWFLGRWNLKKITDEDSNYMIDIPCKICEKYYAPSTLKCSACPLHIFSANVAGAGCVILIKGILRKRLGIKTRSSAFDIDEDYIFWPKHHNKQARRSIGAIRKEIFSMPKISRKEYMRRTK